MINSRFKSHIVMVFIWAGIANAQALNNFVTQLVNENISPPQQEYTTVPFKIYDITLSRDGWIYIELPQAKCDSAGEIIWVTIDSSPRTQSILTVSQNTTVFERMQYLSAGAHQVKMWTSGSPIVGSFKVNAIPEIIYYEADFCSSVQNVYRSLGHDFVIPRDWDYLKSKRLLDVYNVISCASIVNNNASACINGDYAQAIAEWRSMGRKWLMRGSIGWGLTAAETYNLWKSYLLLMGVDGIMLDEFTTSPSQVAEFPKTVEAAQMIANDPILVDKQLYAFTSGTWNNVYDVLLEGFTSLGYRFCPEYYLNEQATESGANSYLTSWLKNQMQLFKNNISGCINNTIITLASSNMAPLYSWDKYPQVSFKCYLDKQFFMLANDPTFQGVYGISFWIAHYTDEEILKWYNALVRHYCIEGKTTMCGDYSYMLNHITNPGFESGLNNWNISPASSGSIVSYDSSALPFAAQLNYPSVPEHQKVLLTVRSAVKPNIISQTITNLEPCSLYVAKVYSCDISDFQTEKDSGVSVRVNGAKVISRKSSHEYYVYNLRYIDAGTGDTIPVAWTSDTIVFQATSANAEIVLSDWPYEASPGSTAIGNQIIWDFVQIEPYYYAPACKRITR